ncbi:MAG: hypothetical protein J6D21_07330 [Clostridia bacterium]|nr:hypothetical protein [Clostridia bacterium]
MSKKKKKRAAETAPSTPKKVVNYRRILFLAVSFLVAMTVYQLAIRLRFTYVAIAYEGIAAALLIWYCIVNQGFGRMVLPKNASEADRADYDRRLRLGKRILGVFFAVLLTLIVDLVDLYILDYFRELMIK